MNVKNEQQQEEKLAEKEEAPKTPAIATGTTMQTNPSTVSSAQKDKDQ